MKRVSIIAIVLRISFAYIHFEVFFEEHPKSVSYCLNIGR